MTFVHLATRSDQSVTSRPAIGDFPGCARVPEFVERAAELGQPAIAFTELGSLRGIYLQTVECDKRGIKPIYGIEVYVCPNRKLGQLPKEQREELQATAHVDEWREVLDSKAIELGYMQSERDLTTLNLWAFDDEGLHNLFALSSLAWIEGYYYKPRVDLDLLRAYSSGVACGTGGPNSYVMRPITEGKRGLALERANELASIYGDRLYCEIRPHRLLVQSKANRFALELEKSGTAKLIATQLAHYLDQGDLPQQKMLTAIVSGKGSDAESSGLPVDSFWLRSLEEMLEAFAACSVDSESSERACSQTLEFAARCTARLEINPFAMVMPEIDTGEFCHAQHLRYLTLSSDKWIKLHDTLGPPPSFGVSSSKWEAYEERLEHELFELSRPVSEGSEATFASYILYVNEVVTMARDLGISLGPGRGSAAGSLVNYLLGITDVDPIEHGLLFSRFLNPNRIGPPDIDVDCDPTQRPKLIAAMRERWGEDCVSSIATIAKLKGRRVAEDLCRELKIDRSEMRAVTRWIDQRNDKDADPFYTIRDAFTGPAANEECLEFAAKYPEFLTLALRLEGVARSVGVHPAGIVAASQPLWKLTPLEVRKPEAGADRVLVTAFDMAGVDQVGLLKIDLLGVKNITAIELAFQAINKTLPSNEQIGWSTIPLDDRATLDAFTAGDLAGVFQFDSSSARKLCSGVEFGSFGVVADITALNRPGPMKSGMADQYLARIKGHEAVEVDYCDEASQLTADTFGVMIYQEQVMQVAEKIGQHKNPDELRSVMGKKLVTKIEAAREPFVDGALQTTAMTREQANKLFDDMATFAEYGFNKSHSVAYAKIGYVCQYLKVHHPLEFWWALLRVFTDNKDRLSFVREAKARNVKLSTPSVQSSGNELVIDRRINAIVGSLSDINGVGSKAASSIMENQPFESFADFIERVDRRVVNSGVIKALAYAGALDSLLENPKWFAENCDELLHESKLKRFKGWDVALAPGALAEKWSNMERLYHAERVNSTALESPYTEVLSELAIELVEAGEAGDDDDSSIWTRDGQSVWVTGTLSDVKVFPNKPFGNTKLSEVEMEHESYLAPQGNATLVLEDGSQLRCKAAWHAYRNFAEEFKDGERVVLLVTVDAQWQTLRVSLAVPLTPFVTGEGLSVWHEILRGNHPLLAAELGDYQSKLVRANTSSMLSSLHAGNCDQLDLLGIVVDVKTKLAGRSKTEMAWVGVLSADLVYSTVTLFSSDWIGGYDPRTKVDKLGCSNIVKAGELMSFAVRSDEYNGNLSLPALGAAKRI